MEIPEEFFKRAEDLNVQLRLAIMFNDSKRTQYLQNQLKAIEEKIEFRKNIEKEYEKYERKDSGKN